jgi:zinc transporter ZupT
MDATLQLRVAAVLILTCVSGVGVISPEMYAYFNRYIKSNNNGAKIDSNDIENGQLATENSKLSSSPAFRVFKVFTGGLLVSVALLHLMPDSNANLADDQLVNSASQYPIAYIMTLGGCLFTVLLEIVGKHVVHLMGINVSNSKEVSQEAIVEIEHGSHPSDLCTHEHLKSSNASFIKLLIIEISVAIHSIAIGFGLGTQTRNLPAIQALIVAMCFHQVFEGLCLGTMMLEVKISTISRILLSLFFTVSLSVGIIIGILTIESSTSQHVEGAANGFAAGCLLYGSLVDIINEEFSKVIPSEQKYLKAYMFCGLLAGCGVMALLAVWA